MKQSYFLFAIFISTFIFSQTKLIAYKSHSGNMANFETSVSKNVFDTNDPNLGEPRPKDFAEIDSVIILDNDKAIVKTKIDSYIENREKRRTTDTISLKGFGKKNTYNDSLEFLVKQEITRKYYVEFFNLKKEKNDSTAYLKYNQQERTYQQLKKETPKPQIKKSEIKKESLMKNGLIILVFILSGFVALNSWRNNRNYER